MEKGLGGACARCPAHSQPPPRSPGQQAGHKHVHMHTWARQLTSMVLLANATADTLCLSTGLSSGRATGLPSVLRTGPLPSPSMVFMYRRWASGNAVLTPAMAMLLSHPGTVSALNKDGAGWSASGAADARAPHTTAAKKALSFDMRTLQSRQGDLTLHGSGNHLHESWFRRQAKLSNTLSSHWQVTEMSCKLHSAEAEEVYCL